MDSFDTFCNPFFSWMANNSVSTLFYMYFKPISSFFWLLNHNNFLMQMYSKLICSLFNSFLSFLFVVKSHHLIFFLLYMKSYFYFLHFHTITRDNLSLSIILCILTDNWRCNCMYVSIGGFQLKEFLELFSLISPERGREGVEFLWNSYLDLGLWIKIFVVIVDWICYSPLFSPYII